MNKTPHATLSPNRIKRLKDLLVQQDGKYILSIAEKTKLSPAVVTKYFEDMEASPEDAKLIFRVSLEFIFVELEKKNKSIHETIKTSIEGLGVDHLTLVAKRTKLSRTTVSKYFNDQKVSRSIAEKILDASLELHKKVFDDEELSAIV
jgi:hypothetical protein